MNDFPDFMKHPANRIVPTSQATPGVEGYVFDGVDDSQMAFWTCSQSAPSTAHVHEFDEYMIVVQGCYTLIIDGQRIALNAGDEYLIVSGTVHSGEVLAGTRTIHAFGGHRANRARIGKGLSTSPNAVDFRERGIDEVQAAGLRRRLATFSEDWERPEMSVYDEWPLR